MRRIPLGLLLVAVPVFAVTVFVSGCGKDEKKDQASSSGGETKEEKKASGPAKVMESKGGVLKGKVTLASQPDVKKLTNDLLKQIDDKKDQKDYCLKGGETEKT